ncbi:MAG TPA: tetratricopeptide repeat protein [Candidatus Pacearchaeota archaeon]|nr:tetratricopeptide repeat protein [Candidatus Pacearchaeota archaeon]HQG09128.1 tetratricopeptide repeat protein [Candidatus Pacearchaeota archaeon]HQH20121.1 tetratricopeptide repeat protein [Candidatus Pacearchaeota archaeon]
MAYFRKIAGWVFGAFFFLLPFFYIPNIGVSYILSQKLLVVVFVLISLILWMGQIFTEKRIYLKKSQLAIFLVGFWMMSAISFFLTPNLLQGFLGRPNTLDSFLMLSAYIGIAILVANFLDKKDLLKFFQSFIFGSIFLSIIFLASLIFNFEIELFSSAESFSLIFALAFVGLNAIIFLIQEQPLKLWQKIINGAALVLLLIPLLIIQSKLSWFVIFLASFLIFWRECLKNNFLWKNKKIIFSLLIFLISLGIFFSPKFFNYDFQLGSEQSISYISGLNIAEKTFQESFKNIFFGSGPATYLYKYSLYKGNDLGDSTLVFNQGPIAFLTLGASLGILALLCLLAAWAIFMIQGFAFWKTLLSRGEKKQAKENFNNVMEVVFPLGVILFFSMCLYKMTLTPLVFSFFVLGAWVNLNKSEEICFDLEKRNYFLQISLIFSVLLFLGGVIFLGKQCLAEHFYKQSIREYTEQKFDEAITNSVRAAIMFGDGDYYVGASQLYILKASDIFNSQEAESRKKEIQDLASQGESLANIATSRDPQNYNVWHSLGLIYENTSFLISDKNKEALRAYEQAQKLAPYNFDVYYAIGRVFEKQGDKTNALINYEKALELNPNLVELKEKIKTLKE